MSALHPPPAADPWAAALDTLGGSWRRRRRRQAAARLFFAAWILALVGVVAFLYLRLSTLERSATAGIATARQEAQAGVLRLAEEGVLRQEMVIVLRRRLDDEVAAQTARIATLEAALAAADTQAAALRAEVERRAPAAAVDARFDLSRRDVEALRGSVAALSARVDAKAELADVAALNERVRGKADEATVRDRLEALRLEVVARPARAEVTAAAEDARDALRRVNALRARVDSLEAAREPLR